MRPCSPPMNTMSRAVLRTDPLGTVPKTPDGTPGPAAADAGFTLIEVLGALTVASLVLVLVMTLWKRGAEWQEQAQVAWHLQAVTAAATDYVARHYDSLAEEAGPRDGPAITLQTLISEGLLPDGFQEHNPWNQSYALTVRSLGDSREEGEEEGSEDTDTAGRLLLLVLTQGGRGTSHDTGDAHFLSVLVPGAARRAGSSAGFIPHAHPDGYGEGQLVAGQGGYVLTLADLGITSPGAGHLGSYTVLGAGSTSSSSDVLHRVPVDGQPELNQMEVDLDMTGCGITNIGSLHLTSWPRDGEEAGKRPLDTLGPGSGCDPEDVGKLFLDETYGLYLCRMMEGSNGTRTPGLALISDSGNNLSVQHMTLASDQDLVSKPVCASGTGMEPQIFVAPSIASSGPSSPSMVAWRAWASEANATTWRVHLEVKNTSHSASGWYVPSVEGDDLAPYYGSVQVITACVRKRAR